MPKISKGHIYVNENEIKFAQIDGLLQAKHIELEELLKLKYAETTLGVDSQSEDIDPYVRDKIMELAGLIEKMKSIEDGLNEPEGTAEAAMEKHEIEQHDCFPSPEHDVDPWKHRSSGMKCSTCMWYVAKKSDAPIEIGRCRRHAPTMNGYPVVYPTDWCGDHKLNENSIQGSDSGPDN